MGPVGTRPSGPKRSRLEMSSSSLAGAEEEPGRGRGLRPSSALK